MNQSMVETDSAEHRVARYAKRRGKRQIDDRDADEMVARIRSAREKRIEEDLAVGIGILSLEYQRAMEAIDAFQKARLGIQTLPIDRIRSELMSELTNNVAEFLRRDFAPHPILRLFARLGGRPVVRRTHADYVTTLRILLTFWPDLPPAIP